MMSTFDDDVASYVALQRALLGELSALIDLKAREYFNDLPPGKIVHTGKVWTYRGHGRGVTFETEGAVVNAHIAPWLPDLIDAWRLELYFDARGIEVVARCGRSYEVNEDSIAALLDDLVRAGTLVPQALEGFEAAKFYRPKS